MFHPARRNGKCRDSEVGTCLACLRKSKESSEVHSEGKDGRVRVDEFGETEEEGSS